MSFLTGRSSLIVVDLLAWKSLEKVDLSPGNMSSVSNPHLFYIIICALFSTYLICHQAKRIFRCQNHDRNQAIWILTKERTSNSEHVNSQIAKLTSTMSFVCNVPPRSVLIHLIHLSGFVTLIALKDIGIEKWIWNSTSIAWENARIFKSIFKLHKHFQNFHHIRILNNTVITCFCSLLKHMPRYYVIFLITILK